MCKDITGKWEEKNESKFPVTLLPEKVDYQSKSMNWNKIERFKCKNP